MPVKFTLATIHWHPGGRLGAEQPEAFPERIVAHWIDDEGYEWVGRLDAFPHETDVPNELPWNRIVYWLDAAEMP